MADQLPRRQEEVERLPRRQEKADRLPRWEKKMNLLPNRELKSCLLKLCLLSGEIALRRQVSCFQNNTCVLGFHLLTMEI